MPEAQGEPRSRVRDAVAGDLPRIVEIYNQSIPGRRATADLERVTVEDRAHWFEQHDPRHWPLWVVEAGGRVAAWLSLERFYGRAAYDATAEVSVYVTSEEQGQGFGRLLLSLALERAPELGLASLVAFVFDHNEPSLSLFEGLGFARWGHLPGVARLDGVERDVVVLGRRVAG
ncbi:MAG TPA: GNAT family N-acetyltransferase [Solirubrobacteraceae bacterium]|nr:GNAT family N-acetyltransferase [Solirubrobacteraceae bacterium]